MKRKIIAILLMVALALALGLVPAAPAGAVPTNLVGNGGFETPSVTGDWDTYDSTEPGLAWTVEWRETHTAPALLELQKSVSTPDWLAYDGSQYAELGSYYATKIFQDLDTEVDGLYLLSFAFSPRPQSAWGTVAQANLQVKWGGTVVDDLSRAWTGSTPAQTEWTYHSYVVQASASTTTLMFIDTGTDDGGGPFLDDVSVVPISIEIGKTADRIHAYEGDTINYTYTVHNDGDVSLSTVAVTDDVTGPASYDSEVSGNDDASFDPGEIWEFTAQYTVPWFYDCYTVENTASATAWYELVKVTADSNTVIVDIIRNPDINIEKDGPGYWGYFETVVDATYTYTVTTGTGDCAIDITSIVDDIYGDLTGYFVVGGDTDGDGYLAPGETWTYEVTDTLECDGYTTEVIINVATVVGENVKEEPVDDSDCWTVILFQWQPRTIGYWGNWDNHYTELEFESLRDEALANSPNLLALADGNWYDEDNVHDFLLGNPPKTGDFNKKTNPDGWKEAQQRFHMEKQFLATWLNVKAYLDWVGIDLDGETPLSLTFPGTADVGMDPNAIVYLTGFGMPEGGKVLFGTDALSVIELLRYIEDNKGGWFAEDFGIAYEVLDIMNNAENNGYLAFMDPTFAPELGCPNPSIDLTKSADADEAIPGETTITYTYEVHNDGGVILFYLTVTDEIDGAPLTVVPTVDIDGYNVGDGNQDGRFEFCETWEFTASFPVPIDYAEETVDNEATATAWWYDIDVDDTDTLSIPILPNTNDR